MAWAHSREMAAPKATTMVGRLSSVWPLWPAFAAAGPDIKHSSMVSKTSASVRPVLLLIAVRRGLIMSLCDWRECTYVLLLLGSSCAPQSIADVTVMTKCGLAKHSTKRRRIAFLGLLKLHTCDVAVGQREVLEEEAACQDVACARQQLSCRYPGVAEGPCMAHSAVRYPFSGLSLSPSVPHIAAHTPIRRATWLERNANGRGKVGTIEEGVMLQVPGMQELPDPSNDHQKAQREGEDCHG